MISQMLLVCHSLKLILAQLGQRVGVGHWWGIYMVRLHGHLALPW